MLANSRIADRAVEREQLLDRLVQLRAIVPAFAKELARARRQAATLRIENRGLLTEVRRLQRERRQTREPRQTHARS
jgi:hypothetical protein